MVFFKMFYFEEGWILYRNLGHRLLLFIYTQICKLSNIVKFYNYGIIGLIGV
jgi:hypothetical protein